MSIVSRSILSLAKDCSGGNSRLTRFLLVSFRRAILISFFVGFGFVSGTEEHLMPALNILFWNQVVEANQFTFCALGPFIA
jgi:hypothetical protein